MRAAVDAGHAVEVVPGPVGGDHRARGQRAARPAASCSRGSCPARARGGRAGSPSWPPSRARSCSTRRPTGWPARSPTWPPRCGADRRVVDRPRADQAPRGALARHARRRGRVGDGRRSPRGELVLVLDGAPPPRRRRRRAHRGGAVRRAARRGVGPRRRRHGRRTPSACRSAAPTSWPCSSATAAERLAAAVVDGGGRRGSAWISSSIRSSITRASRVAPGWLRWTPSSWRRSTRSPLASGLRST